ncbi:uncharacterized protein LOC129226884 [Uloborus diversus]|uniref:uncharacterized protein LOC129226884 n=1 Tax=Uloborus diversus TaxID=327109 RepID=UPI002409C6FC|nr:uncharacterized protein LOC129226884 [Uloborus diversus]
MNHKQNLRKNDDENEESPVCPSFDDCDVEIDNNPDMSADEHPIIEDCMAEPAEGDSASFDTMELMKECFEDYKKSSAEYDVKSDLTAKIQAWEERITPFLAEQSRKPEFNIGQYGSDILNSFEDTDRKQTKIFKDIVKGKLKWEVHRYFLALLPLANVGNVSLEAERHPDGTEDILITLLSRKMHHKEIEKYRHSQGSHD